MRQALFGAGICYSITLSLVLLGSTVGVYCQGKEHKLSRDLTPKSGCRFRDSFLQWDGQWYRQIVLEGYAYRKGHPSNVAFFPVYPLISKAIATLGRVPSDVSLVCVSNCCLIMGYFVLAMYIGTECTGEEAHWNVLPLVALSVFPTAFFFAMAYTESMCLTFIATAMLGMKRRWPTPWIASVIGVTTAIRPVGVALLPVFVLHVYRCSSSTAKFLRTMTFTGPLAMSGIIVYMTYLSWSFDDGLAFVHTQDFWRVRPRVSLLEKSVLLFAFEPIWSIYTRGTWPYVISRLGAPQCVFANLQLANPILLCMAIGVCIIGWRRKWLTDSEQMLSIGLLGIPYITRAYEFNMCSQGRFVLPAFPVFIVLGRLLGRSSVRVRLMYLVISAVFCSLYCWSWARGYVAV